MINDAVRVKAKRRNAAEEGRTPVQVQSAGRHSKGVDVFKNLSHEDLSKANILIFKPRKKFNIPHIASNVPGQVPHESTSITRTIVTRSAGSVLPRKRRSQSAGGNVPEKSGSSSEGPQKKSKRLKCTEAYLRFQDEYRERQDQCLDDPTLPKLEKPFFHLKRYDIEQKATQEGTSPGVAAAEKLLKQAKKMPSPPTARPQGRSLPAQDIDDYVAMPPPTGPPPRCRLLKQPPVSASTMPLNTGKTQPMSQARSFSGNVLSSDSERTRGAATMVCSVVNFVSGQTCQQMMETCQHRGDRGMLARANIPH